MPQQKWLWSFLVRNCDIFCLFDFVIKFTYFATSAEFISILKRRIFKENQLPTIKQKLRRQNGSNNFYRNSSIWKDNFL